MKWKTFKEPFRVICINTSINLQISDFARKKYAFNILKVNWAQEIRIVSEFRYVIGEKIKNHRCVSGVPITEREFKENFRVIK